MQDERSLISRCRRGDEKAFAELVDEHKTRVSNIVYRMTGDSDATEDLTQEVFLRVLRGLHRFRGEARLSTWIYRITCRVCFRELQRRRHRSNQVQWNDETGEWHLRETSSGESVKEDKAEKAEMEEAVARWVDELPPHYKMVISLNYVEDRKYKDIADIMGLPMGTVKTYLHRAKQFLRARAIDEGYVT